MTDQQGTALVERAEKPGRAISAFSSESNFESAQRMAMAFVESDLAPDAYRGDKGVANTLIAMELANRIGASPLMVMQNLHVVKGKPGWASSCLIATVNACGRFTPLRFRFEGEKGEDNWGCRAVATDKDSAEECVGALITIQMAKDEGWWSKKDRNGNETSKWQTMPEQMLMYRAAAFWTRVYAPEISLGLHTADEVADMPEWRRLTTNGAEDLDKALEEALMISEEPNAEEVPDTTRLQRLIAKAMEAGAVEGDRLEGYQLVLHDANPEQVSRAVGELEELLGESQGDLLGQEAG